MNKALLSAVAVAGLVAVSGVQAAEDDGSGIGVGVRAGTLGAGVELGKSFGEKFNVRLGLNKYSVSADQSIDNVDYDATMDYSSTALMFDWHPTGGSFHVTVGYLSSNNELSGTATPDGDITIGDNTQTVSAGELVLDGTVKLGSGPYLGLGWGNVPAKGFGVTLEAGVVQMGTPDVDLDLSGTRAGDFDTTDIQQEIQNMEDDLDEFELYPVIALGFSYGF